MILMVDNDIIDDIVNQLDPQFENQRSIYYEREAKVSLCYGSAHWHNSDGVGARY